MLDLPFDPPHILNDLCECQRWNVAVRYACSTGKRGGAAAASWAAKWTASLGVLITALEPRPSDSTRGARPTAARVACQAGAPRDVLGRLVADELEHGQRLSLLRQLALEGGARCAALPDQVRVVEALRQTGAAPLLAAAAAERLGDRCRSECGALNRQLLAAEAIVSEAAVVSSTSEDTLAATPGTVHFMSRSFESCVESMASVVVGLQSATVVAIDAEWPPQWTEKQARLSGTRPLAALLQLAIVGCARPNSH